MRTVGTLTIEEVKKLRSEGLPLAKIAARAFVSASAVQSALSKEGVVGTRGGARRKAGFTFIELLIVLAVVFVLGASIYLACRSERREDQGGTVIHKYYRESAPYMSDKAPGHRAAWVIVTYSLGKSVEHVVEFDEYTNTDLNSTWPKPEATK